MSDTVQVIITLRKTVADEAAAKAVVSVVKAKLADKPDITMSASITNHIDTDLIS